MKAILLAASLSLLPALTARPATAQTVPVFLLQWGTLGTVPGKFQYPYGGAVASDGSVIVTDQYNFRIQVFGPTGEFIRSWGSPGSLPGQFGIQIGVTTDAQGQIYVADYGNHRVQVFSASGAFLRQFANGVSTVDVARGPDGNDYVVGWPPIGGPSVSHVYVYDSAGQLVHQFGLLEAPRSLAFAPDGRLWVAEATASNQGSRLIQFDPISGAILQSRHMTDFDPSFLSVGGMCILSSGVMCVCDFEGSKVLMLTPLLGLIGTFGGLGSDPGKLISAVDIAAAPDGSFYVVDLKGNKVVRYGSAATPVHTASWGLVKTTYR